MERRDLFTSLLAGGTAGMCVDLILFPLDTFKTRLQSPQGFSKAGGFRGIYAGVPSTAIGSFPNAAAFFVTYESVKCLLHSGSSPYWSPLTHMAAASMGEVTEYLYHRAVYSGTGQQILSQSSVQWYRTADLITEQCTVVPDSRSYHRAVYSGTGQQILSQSSVQWYRTADLITEQCTVVPDSRSDHRAVYSGTGQQILSQSSVQWYRTADLITEQCTVVPDSRSYHSSM
ncbi:mitochondrial S-adenosylmethionine carrier protein isoform X2 [Mixophyes fleayi]|uniref:mitochondrial S-adenosylmethionine carrier protein isoform X2 n=1 Tax=Mixophyes fleayi TaxID=3061075 RepID=UPI003F4E2906